MAFIARTAIATSAAVGLGVSSQAPEFAQQYRQRLGGAIDELRVVVEDFDRDAGNSQMTREDALDQMLSSSERFNRDRGASMARTINRYENLSAQLERLQTASPVMRPLIVMQYPDPQIVEGAWSAYDPAVPVTGAGATYGGLGALILGMLAWLGIGTGGRVRRRRRARAAAKLHEQARIDDNQADERDAGRIT